MLKFIHTADIHFGMENYGKIDPKTGIHTRLLDFKKALDACIDFGIENSIDFFIFSGDAYKTATPSPTQQKLLMECFFRLYKNNIPVIIVVGNHDNPMSFGKATALDVFGNLPIDGFHVVKKPETIILKTKNGPVQIVGIPWPSRNNIAIAQNYIAKTAQELTEKISQSVAHIITEMAQSLDNTVPAVLCGHLTVASGIFSGSEKRAIYGHDPVLLPSQLAIKPFDYVALGHLHRFQNLNENGYPAVVYSGSIERVDFGERKEDKGFCFVEIPEKNKAYYKFIKTPQRKFVQIELDISESDLEPTEQILKEIEKYDILDAVVKIIYHVPESLSESVNFKKIQNACLKAMFLVGIIPIKKNSNKTRRALIKSNMDLETLLSNYFESKPELKNRKEALLKKALELEQY